MKYYIEKSIYFNHRGEPAGPVYHLKYKAKILWLIPVWRYVKNRRWDNPGDILIKTPFASIHDASHFAEELNAGMVRSSRVDSIVQTVNDNK